MDDDQQFCLRWNNHQATLISVFDTLLEKGIHVDCTLAAEGQTLKAHKVVLSACSPYFESVLSQQYDKHPIIILKDVKYAELRAMMDYMYRGEVNISQDQLAALLKAAESLQIKGLSDNKPSRPPSHPTPATTNAHPPRSTSPSHQVRDGSVDSREGSTSPSRRRKKARRASTDLSTTASPVVIPLTVPTVVSEPVPATLPADTPAPCKEEGTRDGVEDLTLDEEAEEPPVTSNNDVVRSFAWHMERSQDEMLNSSDGVRDSQGRSSDPQNNIMTRSKKNVEESTATFAVLKNVSLPNEPLKYFNSDATKENKKAEPIETKAESPIDETKMATNKDSSPEQKDQKNLFPRTSAPCSHNLPCAQYKSEKGYKCPNCQKCYNARKNLVRHVTLECGRDPQYKCPYCSYSKHRRNELKKHIERKHPNQPDTISMK